MKFDLAQAQAEGRFVYLHEKFKVVYMTIMILNCDISIFGTIVYHASITNIDRFLTSTSFYWNTLCKKTHSRFVREARTTPQQNSL